MTIGLVFRSSCIGGLDCKVTCLPLSSPLEVTVKMFSNKIAPLLKLGKLRLCGQLFVKLYIKSFLRLRQPFGLLYIT